MDGGDWGPYGRGEGSEKIEVIRVLGAASRGGCVCPRPSRGGLGAHRTWALCTVARAAHPFGRGGVSRVASSSRAAVAEGHAYIARWQSGMHGKPRRGGECAPGPDWERGGAWAASCLSTRPCGRPPHRGSVVGSSGCMQCRCTGNQSHGGRQARRACVRADGGYRGRCGRAGIPGASQVGGAQPYWLCVAGRAPTKAGSLALPPASMGETTLGETAGGRSVGRSCGGRCCVHMRPPACAGGET